MTQVQSACDYTAPVYTLVSCGCACVYAYACIVRVNQSLALLNATNKFPLHELTQSKTDFKNTHIIKFIDCHNQLCYTQ